MNNLISFLSCIENKKLIIRLNYVSPNTEKPYLQVWSPIFQNVQQGSLRLLQTAYHLQSLYRCHLERAPPEIKQLELAATLI